MADFSDRLLAFLYATIVGIQGVPAQSVETATLAAASQTLSVFPWFVILGFSWLAAFALQGIGEFFRIFPTVPPYERSDLPESNEKQPVKTLFGTREHFRAYWLEFNDVASPHESVHAERMIIIKEACANASVALMLSSIIILAGFRFRNDLKPSYVGFASVGIVLSIVLWYMHREHLKRYAKFVFGTIIYRRQNPHNQVGKQMKGKQDVQAN